MTVTITPLTERDFFSWYELFTEYAATAEVPADDQHTMRVWTALQGGAAHAILAQESGRAVGFAHFTEFSRLLQGDTGYTIEDLFVRREDRGHGIASAMVEHIRSRAEDEHRATVRWVGRPLDAAVRALQEKFAATTGDWAVHDLVG